jgi:hypothetical protein
MNPTLNYKPMTLLNVVVYQCMIMMFANIFYSQYKLSDSKDYLTKLAKDKESYLKKESMRLQNIQKKLEKKEERKIQNH